MPLAYIVGEDLSKVCFTVPIVDDNVTELNETFQVTLSSTTLSVAIDPNTDSAKVSIVDNEGQVAVCVCVCVFVFVFVFVCVLVYVVSQAATVRRV